MVSYRAALVFPAFNEAERLKIESFREFARQHVELLLIFVNDGSKDETGDLLSELKAEKNVSIINLESNVGKAEAMRRGFMSLKEVEVDIIGFADSDLATPLCEIFRVLDLCPVNRPFFIIGSRKKLKSNKIERRKVRLYASYAFKWAVSFFTSFSVEDSQCGLKFFSRELAFDLFDRPFVSRWLFDVELLLRLGEQPAQKLVIMPESVSLNRWIDIPGGSLGLKDFILSPFVLAYVVWRYSWKKEQK